MKRTPTKNLTLSGVFAAAIFVLTAFARIPLGVGYIHLGDAAVYAACFFLGAAAIPAAAAGGALADLIGYPQYAIPTFIIKGLMSAVIVFIGRFPYAERVPAGVADGLPARRRGGVFISLRAAAACVAGAAVMHAGYAAADYILAGVSGDAAYAFAIAEFLKGLIQTAVCLPLALAVCPRFKRFYLRPAETE